MLISELFNDPLNAVLLILAIVVALTIHEFAHAFIAFVQGDHTAEDQGRLTLNPLAHIDLMGFILFVIAGFGWAKPTPFNPYNLKYKRFGPVFVALAGPAVNMLFGILILLIIKIVLATTIIQEGNLMIRFFWHVFFVNISLAIFNLIPIPPLDGSKVLYAFIIEKYSNIVLWLERYGIYLLLILLIFFDYPMNVLIRTVHFWLIDLFFF